MKITYTTQAWFILSLILLSFTGCGGSATQSAKSENEEATSFREVEFRDEARGNIVAQRILVPNGWTTEGGIIPSSPALKMIPVFTDIAVKAPDKRSVRFYGLLEFGYADGVQLPLLSPYLGRPFFPPQKSLGDFWLLMSRHHPAPGISNVRIISEEVLPEATELVRKQLAPLYQRTEQENRQLAFSGQRKTFTTEARKLVMQYDDEGVEVEAVVFAVISDAVYRYANGRVKAGMWTINYMYAMAAPVGTDPTTDPVLAAIVQSRRIDPEWQAAIQRDYMRIGQNIISEGRAKIAAASRAAAQTKIQQSDDVLDISFNGWKKRSAMSDAGQARQVNAIHERTTYAHPGGETIRLPSYYQNVYTDGQGNYVLHNNANYQINTDPVFNDRNWQQIEEVR